MVIGDKQKYYVVISKFSEVYVKIKAVSVIIECQTHKFESEE